MDSTSPSTSLSEMDVGSLRTESFRIEPNPLDQIPLGTKLLGHTGDLGVYSSQETERRARESRARSDSQTREGRESREFEPGARRTIFEIFEIFETTF